MFWNIWIEFVFKHYLILLEIVLVSFVANFVRVGNSAVVAFYVQVILKVNRLGLFCHFYDENI